MPVDFERQGAVAVLTLNRPKVLNAVSPEVLDRLGERLDMIESDPEVRAVVLTGSGKAFSAGADVSSMRTATPLEARAFAESGHVLTMRIERFPKPVIAAVNGFALGGGCELALACDIRLAGRSGKFGLPELKLGIVPGWGGTRRLAHLTNPARAREIIFTGRMVDAQEAGEIGLANAVHADDALLDAAIEMAGEIAKRSPWALAMAKELVNLSLAGDPQGHLSREADAFGLAFTTEDAREGIEAFLEKREARFSGS